MNDLDQAAINDTKHDLCDILPCIHCADFKYKVNYNSNTLDIHYGSNVFNPETQKYGNFGRERALAQASEIARLFNENCVKAHVYVQVFDQNDSPDEISDIYEFANDGTYKKTA